jgi:hypothetical protein
MEKWRSLSYEPNSSCTKAAMPLKKRKENKCCAGI